MYHDREFAAEWAGNLALPPSKILAIIAITQGSARDEAERPADSGRIL
jgi:hypothetical protein